MASDRVSKLLTGVTAILLLAAGAAFAQAPPPPPAPEPDTPVVPAPAPTEPQPPPLAGEPAPPAAGAQFPPPAFPQAPTLAPAPPSPIVPVGPPDVRPFALRGFVRVEGEYNDNFFRTPNHRTADYRETLTPGLAARFLSGSNEANLSYSPSLVHSSVVQDDILLFHLFDANGTLGLTDRLTLRATEHFDQTDEPALADPLNLQRTRRVVTTELFGASLRHAHDTWSIMPRYNFTLIDFSTSGTTGGPTTAATLTDEHTEIHVVGLDGALQALPRNVIALGYEYTIARFRVSPDFTGHLGRVSLTREVDPQMIASATASFTHREPDGSAAFDIWRGDVGIRRDLRPRYLVEARVGYFATDAVKGDDGTGIEYLAQGTYRGRWMTLIATSSRSLAETFATTVNAGVVRQQRSALEIRVEPAPPLTVSLRGSHTESTFLQAGTFATTTGITTTGGHRRDTTIEGSVEIAYKLSRALTLSLRYTRVELDSNVRIFNYVNNRVGAALTATFE